MDFRKIKNALNLSRSIFDQFPTLFFCSNRINQVPIKILNILIICVVTYKHYTYFNHYHLDVIKLVKNVKFVGNSPKKLGNSTCQAGPIGGRVRRSG